jgi:radical SAM protein with 4Fe4S-binding SPASM domain
MVSSIALPSFELWDKLASKRIPLAFELEVTARCNNDCRHCYINLPAGDPLAIDKELSVAEIADIAHQAVELGALWCLITGGEPLLRKDLPEIYLALKRQGMLVSVFTNATLVTKEHVELFKKYPPRDIEVTVYGVTRETYERVTRRPGSFAAFMRGLDLLLDAGIKVRLKAMALCSNKHELPEIGRFCRERTKDYYRFDPLLHLRYDGDPLRNKDIRSERLDPSEIVALERADKERMQTLEKGCDSLIGSEPAHEGCDHLFHCGAGIDGFTVGYDGLFRLCSSLWHPKGLYDLRKGSVADAWNHLVPTMRNMRSSSPQFVERCRRCPIINLCLWCPAHAFLEAGEMDAWIEYFCKVAHSRADAISNNLGKGENPGNEIP